MIRISRFVLTTALVGGFALTSHATDYYVDQIEGQFYQTIANELAAGRQLVDVEMIVVDGDTDVRYSGSFKTLPGSVHYILRAGPTAWDDFVSSMDPLPGRWLDFEVTIFQGQIVRSGVFWEDGGENYRDALQSDLSESEFQTELKTRLDEGFAPIDFESFVDPSGNTRYGALWVDGLLQPRTNLIYGLTWPEVEDLLDPLAGRVVDVERYRDAELRTRYGIVLAAHPDGDSLALQDLDAAGLAAQDAARSDFLVDLDMWEESPGTIRYAGVWGDDWKSLRETDPTVITQVIPNGTDIDDIISAFEAGGQGVMGLFGRNVRLGKSIEYRPDRPFYLASSVKFALHVRLWQLDQQGHLDVDTDTIRYGSSTSDGTPWFVDERNDCADGSECGLTSGACGGSEENDLGRDVLLRELARGMMRVSDNASTSMLVDDPTFGLAFDSPDINTWLSGLSGVGRGIGVITSIQDLDRHIMWQGQWPNSQNDPSYFGAPRAGMETRFRRNSPLGYRECRDGAMWTGEVCGCNGPDTCSIGTCQQRDDPWGDLLAYVQSIDPTWPDDGTYPFSGYTMGHDRYYTSGLSFATPRAFAELQKQFINQELLDEIHTEDALGEMTFNSSARLGAGVPSHIERFSKGGSKDGTSSPCSDTIIYRVGPDSVVANVMTGDNQRSCGAIRSFWASPPTSSGTPLGRALVERLFADISATDPPVATFSPTTVRPGQEFSAVVDLTNLGGVEASAFDVVFYATLDADVTDGNDVEIGRVRISGLAAGDTTRVRLDTTFPNIAANSYGFGWWADPADPAGSPPQPFGEVGEFAEDGDQWSVLDDAILEVLATGPPCPDGDLDGVHACDASCDATGLVCGDCDDGDDAVNPSAVDLCNQLDDDCDGSPDPGATRPMVSRAIADPSPETSEDLGLVVSRLGDVDGDGVNDLAIAQPSADSPVAGGAGLIRVHSGATRALICEAYDPAGSNADDFGVSIAGIDDVTGDGVRDFVVGAPAYDGAIHQNSGAAVVFNGATCDFVSRLESGVSQEGDRLGTAVVGLGDLNLDGFDEIGVGVPRRDNGGSDNGAIIVYSGATLGALATWSDPGSADNDRLGEVLVRTTDLDGDLIDDLIVGAPNYGNTGAVIVMSGSTGDVVDVWTRAGANSGDSFGFSVADLGDVTGDGVSDFLVGAKDADTLAGTNSGDAQILSGADGQPVHTLSDLSGSGGDDFGYAVASAGDVDGDGLEDAAVGAPLHEGSAGVDSGSVVVFSSATGAVLFDLEDPASRAGERFGWSLANLGDLTGDGLSEFAAGAPRADHPEAARAGRVVVWSAESDCDGDGTTPFVGDCDDQAAAAYPGAVETCDGLDNDCDSLTDEDDDGDGFTVCAECDDGDAAIFPGAPERCNGLDDDCDSDIDEGVDSDLDGFDDVCDCNDAVDTINPGATDDACDRLDADCNGVTDDGFPTPTGTRVMLRDMPGSGEEFASGLALIGDLSGDGVPEIVVGIPQDDSVSGNAGAVAVLNGASGALHCLMTDPDGSGNDRLGTAVDVLEDVTGDGIPDVAAGAPRDDDPEGDAGSIVVFSGADCLPAYKTFDPQGGQGDLLGNVVAAIGDIDGDGASEFAAAAPGGDDQGLTNAGRVVVFDGASGALLYRVLNINAARQEDFGDSIDGGSDLDADGVPDFVVGVHQDSTLGGGSVLVVSGASGVPIRKLVDLDGGGTDALGISVALIDDLDGDAVADVLAGARNHDTAGNNSGGVVVFSGADGSFIGRATSALPGFSERLGTSVVALPDIDGDEVADFAAGAPFDEDSGSDTGSVVLFSGATLTMIDRMVAENPQDFEQLGSTLAGGLDLSGDGMPDVIAGAPLHDSDGLSSVGRAVIFAREADCDGDGVNPWGGDCDDTDADAFERPGDARSLVFDSVDMISWQPPAEPGGTLAGLTYDVLRSGDASDFVAGGICDTTGTAATSATVPSVPASGTTDFYVVRANNTCGDGPAGNDSEEMERPATPCP